MNKNNWYDIAFLIIFFVSLNLPMICIDTTRISHKENRYLSQYIPLYNSKEKKFNFNYGNDLDAYIKEHFWGRMKLISLDRYINYYLSKHYVKFSRAIIDKKNKFMHEHLTAVAPDSKSQRALTEGLKKFNEWCKENNIKLYTVIMPRKEMIYNPDLVLSNLVTYNNNNINKSIAKASAESGVNIIFTLDEFLKKKKTSPYLLYHKTDHHATIDGTYITYKALLKQLKKDFPEIKRVKFDDYDYYEEKKVATEPNNRFYLGYTCYQAGIPNNICESFLDTPFRYVHHKDEKNLSMVETRDDNIIKYDYFYPKGSDLRVLVFGDSFAPNLMKFLSYTFKNTCQIRLNGPRNIKRDEQNKILKYYKNEILEYKPDIIIIDYFYSNYVQLRNIATEED